MTTIKHKNREQSRASHRLFWLGTCERRRFWLKIFCERRNANALRKFFVFFSFYSIVCRMTFYGSCVPRFLLTFKRIHFTMNRWNFQNSTQYSFRICFGVKLMLAHNERMAWHSAASSAANTLHLIADGSIAIRFLFHFLFSQIKVVRKSCEAVKESKTILHLFISILLRKPAVTNDHRRRKIILFCTFVLVDEWLTQYELLVSGVDCWRRNDGDDRCNGTPCESESLPQNGYYLICAPLCSHVHRALLGCQTKANKSAKYCRVNIKLKKKFQTAWADTLDGVW